MIPACTSLKYVDSDFAGMLNRIATAPGGGFGRSGGERFSKDLQYATHCALRSRADSTLNRYMGHWNRFKNYCAHMGVSALPARPTHVAMYFGHLLRRAKALNYGYNCIKQASAAIFAAHELFMGDGSVTSHPFVKAVRVHAHKALGGRVGRHRKQTLTQQICSKTVLRLLGSPSLYSLQVSAFIMICFVGFLRFSDAAVLRVHHLTFCKNYLTIRIPKRKNDQFRQGSVIRLAAGTSAACPMRLARLLVGLILHHGGSQFSPLFQRMSLYGGAQCATWVNGRGWSYAQASRCVLREIAISLGISVRRCRLLYGLHSLRSGGASRAAALGVRGAVLQEHGGWRDARSMQVYIKRPLSVALDVSKRMRY